MKDKTLLTNTGGLARYALLLWCLLMAGPMQGQDSLRIKFGNYSKGVVLEKIYVHTDRDSYLTGETLWFKVYLTDGSRQHLQDISKVAYVEVLDQANTQVLNAKVSVDGGVGTGTLFIPASLNSGVYHLRAYTNWMKNFDAGYFFQKNLTIVNTFIKLDNSATTVVAEYDAQFFPEGGSLIAGETSTIAFKISDQAGKGLDFKGSVVDDSNDTLIRFSPFRFGMGKFDLQPAAGKKYRVIVRVPRRPIKSIALPTPLTDGYSMRVDRQSNQIVVTVSAHGATGGDVFLLTHTRQIQARVTKKYLQDGKVSFNIPLQTLEEGVSHFTVFNSDGLPVCERLVFKRPTRSLDLTLQSAEKQFGKRSPVKIDIQVNSKAATSMSVSVFKLDSLSEAPAGHIFDYLWLGSDIRGFIESPEFYVSDDSAAEVAADNLMLTQGWRKFKWDTILKGKPEINYAPEFHGHLIQGVVKDKTGKPAEGVITYLTAPSKIIDVNGARSDSKGKVLFELMNFVGDKKVITYADSSYQLELQNPFSEINSEWSPGIFRLDASTEKNLLNRSVGMQVQNIYYEDSFAPVVMDSSAFYGVADETYLLDDYTRFPVMEEVMREYVPGVLVRKGREGFRFILLDMVNKRTMTDPPMILLDGVPVFDVNKIMAFDPLRVKKLEVVTRKFYHGLLTFNGVVSYTTYKGDLGGFPLDARYVDVNYEGLAQHREFYAPKYETIKAKNSRLPDQRSLLFWDPFVNPDGNGATSVQFYTGDVPGMYQIIVEGINSEGKAGSGTLSFTVKN